MRTKSYPYQSSEVALGNTTLLVNLIPTSETGDFAVSAMIYGFVAVDKIGPYQLEIKAKDPTRKARSIRFTRVLLRTDKRSEEMSCEFLGDAVFRDGVAVWKFQGEVYTNPKHETTATVVVDATVYGPLWKKQGRVELPVTLVESKQTEFHSLPAELVSAIRVEESKHP